MHNFFLPLFFSPKCSTYVQTRNLTWTFSTDEYVRSIFDNFEMACTDVDSCNRTRNLREALEIFLEPAMVRKSVAISAGWHIRLADHIGRSRRLPSSSHLLPPPLSHGWRHLYKAPKRRKFCAHKMAIRKISIILASVIKDAALDCCLSRIKFHVVNCKGNQFPSRQTWLATATRRPREAGAATATWGGLATYAHSGCGTRTTRKDQMKVTNNTHYQA